MPNMDVGTGTDFEEGAEDYESKKEDKAVEARPQQDFIPVKFITYDYDKYFTMPFLKTDTIHTIKTKLVDIFLIPYKYISLSHDLEMTPVRKRLNEFSLRGSGILELKFQSLNPDYPINLDCIYEGLLVPDIITVRIEDDDGEARQVVVEVLDKTIEKPQLGGYRHTQTGVKYYHAFSQTGPYPSRIPAEKKRHRNTQTCCIRNRNTQTRQEKATQMNSLDVWIPSYNDKILQAQPYETADERQKRNDVEEKVKIIQRYLRAWIIKKALRNISLEYKKLLKEQEETIKREKDDDLKRKRKDLLAKAFPLTSDDFAMLYAMVERWKKAELERIRSFACGPSKIAEFYLLLEKEVEIIQSIERLRIKVSYDHKVQNAISFFKAIGTPLKWNCEYKNLPIEMDTLETQKGREYFAIYKSLINRHMSREERIKVYGEVKEYLATHSCDDALFISSLIDRMCALLARGFEDKYLVVLQKRIEETVFHHFGIQECNLGVTAHCLQVKEKMMENNLYFCKGCQNLKMNISFSPTARDTKFKICTACKWFNKVEEPWVDLAPYKFILKQVRNYERLHNALSSISFIVQEKDIHYLIDNIWHGKSALSESRDLYELRLVRWRKKEDWAPWNTILLTKDEANAHLAVLKLRDVYEKDFMDFVSNKHFLAKKTFLNLGQYDAYFSKRAKEDPRLDGTKDYTPLKKDKVKMTAAFRCN